MRVGIVGCGVVGGATAVAVERGGHTVARFDPPKNLHDDIAGCDLIFFCLNTREPTHGVLHEAMAQAATANSDALFAIRSTVVPGTTDSISQELGRPVVFVPEFLREATVEQDALHPDKLVVGTHDEEHARIVAMAMAGVFSPNMITVVKPVEAELAKLGLNALALLKVVYANELYDVAQAYGADYYEILRIFAQDRNINVRHLDPLAGGYRGASGKCLPKDTEFLIHSARVKGITADILSLAESENRNILDGFTTKQAHGEGGMKIAYVNKFSHTKIGHQYKYAGILKSLYGGDELDEHHLWLHRKKGVVGRSNESHVYFSTMVELLLKERPTVAVIPGDTWPMWRYCYGADIPYILIQEDIWSWRSGEESSNEKQMIENAQAIIFTSEDHQEYCADRYCLPPSIVVHLRPLRKDLDFEPLPKLPGKTLVYAGGLVPKWEDRNGLFGYRAYHEIFTCAISAGWEVHVYNPYIARGGGAVTQHYKEYKEIGVIPHRAVSNDKLYRELSQYTAGLHGYNMIGVPQAAANYVQACRPNKCWEYLAAGIPTLGVWPGRSGEIFDGKWGTVLKFSDLSELQSALKDVSFPPITDELRFSQTIEQDIPLIRALLDPILGQVA